jgi:hypothetical protein
MNNAIQILCSLILTFLITSCSILKIQRDPATKEILQTQTEVLRVFEFRASKIFKSGEDYRKSIQEYIVSTKKNKNLIAIDFVEDSTLPKGVAYFPEFQVKDNYYKIIILHSKDAANDPIASSELLNFLITIRDENYFVSYFSPFEMYYNAMELDPIAVHNWAKIREAAVVDAHRILAVEWSKEKEDWPPYKKIHALM